MESNPPQEEGKEEVDQGAGPDPAQLSIEQCKLKLENTKKAALLSLLQFEEVWNPDGHSDDHIYEDNRNELVSAMEKRVKDEERSYFERIIGEWLADGGIKIERFPAEARKLITWMGGLVDGYNEWRPARSGAFLGQSFTARCKLVG